MPFHGYRKFPPVRTEVDGVFEGGGTLGAAYIGATMALRHHGVGFKRLAGTSAGTIIASLLAVGYDPNEIDYLCAPQAWQPPPNQPHLQARPNSRPQRPTDASPLLDGMRTSFRSFIDIPPNGDFVENLDDPTMWQLAFFKSIFVIECLKIDITKHAALLMVGAVPGLGLLAYLADALWQALSDSDRVKAFQSAKVQFIQTLHSSRNLRAATNLVVNKGIAEGEAFLQTVDELLRFKYGQIMGTTKSSPVLFRELTMVDDLVMFTANVTTGRPLIYSKANTPNASVAEAVRRSMSVPFLFRPRISGQDVIVDGGIIENFPYWVFFEETRHVIDPAAASSRGRGRRPLVVGGDLADRVASTRMAATLGLQTEAPVTYMNDVINAAKRVAKLSKPQSGRSPRAQGQRLKNLEAAAGDLALLIENPPSRGTPTPSAREIVAFWLDEQSAVPRGLPRGPFKGVSEWDTFMQAVSKSGIIQDSFNDDGKTNWLWDSTAKIVGQKLDRSLRSLFHSPHAQLVVHALSAMNMKHDEVLRPKLMLAEVAHPNFGVEGIPVRDYFWLDFSVGDDAAQFDGLAARGYWSALELLSRRATRLLPHGQGVSTENAYV